uniref:Ig-like domain-containing protein n=1 Tax=Hucho hucho TaxID=62062 RepID=A0A4W5NVU0_9TELE
MFWSQLDLLSQYLAFQSLLFSEKDEYTLIISEVKTEYEGEYTCTASNRFAEQWVEKMFKATVQPPNFTSQIKPIKCQEGGEAYFKYKVTGDPIPDVQWYKSARQILPGKYCIIVNNPDGSGFINMKGIQQQDSGLYTCKASNPSGEASCMTGESSVSFNIIYATVCILLFFLGLNTIQHILMCTFVYCTGL